PATAPEDRQAAAQVHDFAPRAALGGVGPGPVALLELKEQGEDLAQVMPVARVVRLEEKLPAGDEGTVDERREGGAGGPAVGLARLGVRLRVVAVDFGDAGRLDVPFEQLVGADDREPEVGQAALVGPAGGVADDDGQDVHAEVVERGPPHGTAEQEVAVAAA